MDLDIVGLIPAGGVASRLGKLPCSKEILPYREASGRVSVLSANLLHYFSLAGIQKALFIIRKGKWDIPEYFGDGRQLGIDLGYLITGQNNGTPYTLNQACAFVSNRIVALGFPDIILEPENAFAELKQKFITGHSDIIMGVVPSKDYLKSDMIGFDDSGKICEIVIKQNRPDLKYSWFAALWRPTFTIFMHDYLEQLTQSGSQGKISQPDGLHREVFVGDVILAALRNGLRVDHHIFTEGYYRDLGTWDEFHKLSGEG